MKEVQHQELDELDRRILEALARDARMPNSHLAQRLGIAPSTCLARIRALREARVIRGFHADIDPAAVGRPMQAMIAVQLAAHTRDQIESFTEHVRALPGVLNVFHMTGQTDYLLWVASADATHLREFVVEHLASDPAVARAETSIVYEMSPGPGLTATL